MTFMDECGRMAWPHPLKCRTPNSKFRRHARKSVCTCIILRRTKKPLRHIGQNQQEVGHFEFNHQIGRFALLDNFSLTGPIGTKLAGCDRTPALSMPMSQILS